MHPAQLVAFSHSESAAHSAHGAPVSWVFMNGATHGVQLKLPASSEPRRHSHCPGVCWSKTRSGGHVWQSAASAIPGAKVKAPDAHATTFGISAALSTGQKEWRGHGLHTSVRFSLKLPATHTHSSRDAAPACAVVRFASCERHSVWPSLQQYEPTGHVAQARPPVKKPPATHRHAAAEELFAGECDPALHCVCWLFAQ